MADTPMNISIVRGAFLNPYELQNYYPLIEHHSIKAISSKFPINDKVELPLTKLWSPTDLPNFPYKYPLLNRIFTDAHYLYGLEDVIAGSDLAHVAETYFHYTIQTILAKRKGLVKKVVSTCWEIIPHNNEGIRGRRIFKEFARNNIDHFICPTTLAKKALAAENVNPEKITVIRMGVDLNRFKPVKRTPHSSLKVLFIGRLVEEKGVKLVLEAYRLSLGKDVKVELTMIGDGPMSNVVASSGAITKRIKYERIHKEYQQADIFVLPSQNTPTWQEQYGMVLVEAMACGLPIVASRNGAIPEICGNVPIYIETAKDLATSFTKLNDPVLRRKKSRKSLARARKEFDSKKIAKQIEKVYLSVLKK